MPVGYLVLKRRYRAKLACSWSSCLEEHVTHEVSHPEFIWWNGERRHWEECTIHVTELGWSTVGAVFEGIRAYAGDTDEMHVFRLREHLERLERSMRLVRLDIK